MVTNKVVSKSKGLRQAVTPASGTVRTQNDDEIGEATMKHKIRCQKIWNVDDQHARRESTEIGSHTQPTLQRDTASIEYTKTREHEVPHRRRRTGRHNELCSGLVDTHGEEPREEDLDKRPVLMRCPDKTSKLRKTIAPRQK